MAKAKRFEFADRRARNAFLQSRGLCIAGSIRQQPNIRDVSGRFVGSATEDPSGKYLVDIVEPYCEGPDDPSAPVGLAA